MKKDYFKLGKIAASALLLTSLVLPFGSAASAEDAATAASSSQVKLRILGTTDIHANIMDYDYYKDAPTLNHGLVRTATLIEQARKEAKNTILVDNGDTIQGNPLADYVAKGENKVKPGELHPVYKAMEMLQFDAGTLGNHEFNYGLDFLDQLLAVPNFPILSANVYIEDHDNDDSNDKNRYTPYVILNQKVEDESGAKHDLKVGIIGLVTPQIMQWDKAHLEGKVKVKDIVTEAEKFIPKMKQEGADVVVVLAHSGFDKNAKKGEGAENAVYPLSQVADIDAIVFGHRHINFPGTSSDFDAPGVDKVNGTINGVPAVQPGQWGNHLGQIDLTLEKKNDSWDVVGSKSEVKSIRVPDLTANAEIAAAVKTVHEGTLQYVRSEIGQTTADMYSYFARVQDDSTIQIVNNAQSWFVEKYIAEKLPEYKGIPVISAGAPFKAGRASSNDYTFIEKGPLSIKSANDLYLYDNTLKAVELTGAQVKEWIEMSAGQFNKIDANSKDPQVLINYTFEPFNFDVIDGLTYQIDVTQDARYDLQGNLVNPNSHRVIDLKKKDGTAVKPTEKFIVVTNNYRANGGGNFPGLKGSKIVVDSADENRQILMEYIQQVGTVNPSADNNWRIAHINDDVQLTFKSTLQAKEMANNYEHITFLGELEDEKGTWGSYSLKLQDFLAPSALIVNTVKDSDKKVSGKAEAGSTITLKVGSKKIGEGKTKKNGNFSIPVKPQKAGTKITVTAKGKAGKVSETTTVVVDKTAPAAPTVNSVTDQSKKVTGKAEANSKISIYAGKTRVGYGTTNKYGKFSVTLKKQQKAGTKLTVTATDKAKNVSKATTVVVLDKTAPAAPKVNAVKHSAVKLTGKAEAGAKVTVKANGKVIGTATANKKGTYTVKIQKQKAGTTLSVTAKDKAGNTSKVQKVKVK